MGKGLYSWLPLGMLVMRNIGHIIQEEMKKLGAQEVLLPLLSPLELWKSSGRSTLNEFLTVQDSHDETLVVSPGHEEAMSAMIRDLVTESSQLPVVFYQMQSKVRKEASFNILRSLEFVMTDIFSVHRSFSDLNNFIPKVYHSYARIFRGCGLKPMVAEGSTAHSGGEKAYDFVLLQKGGEYELVVCQNCGYIADRKIAVGLSRNSYSRPMPLAVGERKIERYSEISTHIGLPKARVARSTLWRSGEAFVMTVTCADQVLSPDKVRRITGEALSEELSPGEYESLGFCQEFCSPLGLDMKSLSRQNIKVVVDNAVAETPNLVIAGNSDGSYHFNANFGRDFEGHFVGDIAMVTERHRCYHCAGPLRIRQGVKLANISRVGDYYTRRLGIKVREGASKTLFPHMGSYGLGLDRLVGAVAESLQDRRGLLWPLQLSPYKAVLIVVGKSMSLANLADSLYQSMPDLLLWDDRALDFTRKCRDADRMGIPIRIIVSSASLRSRKVGFIYRPEGRSRSLAIDTVKAEILDLWKMERTRNMSESRNSPKIGCEDAEG